MEAKKQTKIYPGQVYPELESTLSEKFTLKLLKGGEGKGREGGRGSRELD